jgi:hypothetical protein
LVGWRRTGNGKGNGDSRFLPDDKQEKPVLAGEGGRFLMKVGGGWQGACTLWGVVEEGIDACPWSTDESGLDGFEYASERREGG